MVCVPGGPYVQGCPEDCPPKPGWYPLPDPADLIFLPYDPAADLPEFQIHTTEVTVEAYSECVGAGACLPAACIGSGGNWPFDATTAQHPANCMRTVDADAYCEWRGGQLGIEMRVPTECEWEKAARGNLDGRAYVGGDAPPGCNGGQVGGEVCDIMGTAEVGSNPNDVSPYGALDMMGNVSEITVSPMRDGSPEWVTRGANFSSASLEHLELQMRVDFRYPSSYDGDVAEGAASFGFRCVAGPSFDDAIEACPPL
jgi:formylglycine-generating enzyme required for sulfatase activity